VQAKCNAMKRQTLATKSARLRTSVARPATDRTEIAIKKILAPTDFSPASQKALKYALRFAHDFGSELTLLHVLEPAVSPACGGLPTVPAFSEAEIGDAEESLRTLVKSVRGAGVARLRSTIRTGAPTHEIVQAAKELDGDLIVIATHGYTGWKHFAIGSTAARVARAAPCPVLVVREKEHDFL
jgi:universal stress protein A